MVAASEQLQKEKELAEMLAAEHAAEVRRLSVHKPGIACVQPFASGTVAEANEKGGWIHRTRTGGRAGRREGVG